MADNADRAGEQQAVLDQARLDRRPRPAPRPVIGNDCLGCGEEIPAQRRAVLPGACLCIDCQEDAERAMGR